MKFKVIVGGTLLVLLSGSFVWAGGPWKEKPWTEWTEKDLKKVLQDSPWCKTVVMTVTVVPGNIFTSEKAIYSTPRTNEPDVPVQVGTRTGGVATAAIHSTLKSQIQWASSLTIRQAISRKGQLARSMTNEEASQSLALQPQELNIVVKGPHVSHMLHRMEGLTEDSFRKAVYLKLKSSKQQIHTVDVIYDISRQTASFYFPRESQGKPVISPNEKTVEFHWVSPKKKIKTTFDLRKMVRDGKPDL